MNTTSSIKIKITTTDGGCGVKIFAADTNAFTYAISELKGIIPAAFRNYDPTLKTWIVTDWKCLDEWLDELRSVYAVETEYDDEQPSRPPPQSIASPFQTLYLLPNAPPEVVKASYKALAKIHHPDARGDSAKMIEINRAYETLTRGK
ncbi:MAG: J domain-containing protein [Pyrinomonadaceae bacterium]